MFNSLHNLLSSIDDNPSNFEAAQINRTLSKLADGSFADIEVQEVNDAVRVLGESARIGQEQEVVLVSDFVNAKEAFEQNRELCIPFVRQASDGLPQARAEYEKRRVCCYDLAPEYIRHEIVNLCVKELKTLNSQSIIPPDDKVAASGIRYWLDSKEQTSSSLPLLAGFPLVVTYTMGSLMRDILGELEHSPHLIIQDRGGQRLPIDCFNPASEGPVGAAAFRAFSQSLDLLLKAAIIEDTLFDLSNGSDFIRDHDYSSFDAVKLSTVRSSATPWDICKSPLLLNMSLLAELSEAGELAKQTPERVMMNPMRLLSRTFKNDLEDMNFALVAKENKRKKQTAPINSTISAPPETMPVKPQFLTEKLRFFRALQGAAGGEKDLRTISNNYSALYSAYKRGFATLTECLDLVRAGSNVFPMPANAEPWSNSLATPSVKQEARVQPINGQDALLIPQSVEDNYEIRGYNAPWFQDWLSSIPAREQRLINKRLDRAQKGQFLDYLQLRYDPRLFEFRFHLGEGKRIIFSFTEENVITLHTAGSKKDQDALIKGASAALAKETN